MGWILTLIIAGLIGWLAGVFIGKDVPFGFIGNILAGLLGASIANAIGLDFGPIIGGVSIFGGVFGAIILILFVSLIIKTVSGTKTH